MSKNDPLPRVAILDQLREKAFKECIPLNATVEITMSCNLSCHHCYNFDRSSPMPNSLKDYALSPTEISNILRDLIDHGAFFVNLTGGEALLHPHIHSFIKLVSDKQAICRVKSNGALISDEKALQLKDSGLQGADITLYGMSEDSYFKFCGKRSFAAAKSGILALLNNEIDVHVNFLIHKFNVHELGEFLDWIKPLGITFSISDEITERYDSSSGATQFRIERSQLEELLKGPHREYFDAHNSEHALQCSCARSVVAVSVTGKVYPCIGAPIEAGDLRKQDFISIWNNSPAFAKIRNLKNDDFVACMSCDVIEYCQRSSGAIYCDTDNYTGCSDWALTSATLRRDLKKYR